jgi:ATP synthase subunit H
MTFWLVILATFLMWTMWICAFMHQIYPLARPTIPRPVYKLTCQTDALCADVSQLECETRLYGYTYDTVNKKCKPTVV